jgi:hypothetical protein
MPNGIKKKFVEIKEKFRRKFKPTHDEKLTDIEAKKKVLQERAIETIEKEKVSMLERDIRESEERVRASTPPSKWAGVAKSVSNWAAKRGQAMAEGRTMDKSVGIQRQEQPPRNVVPTNWGVNTVTPRTGRGSIEEFGVQLGSRQRVDPLGLGSRKKNGGKKGFGETNWEALGL